MPSKKGVRAVTWFFRAAIPTGIFENLGNFVLELFRGREQHQSISLPGLHTITFSVPAQPAASSVGNVVCGFVRGPTVMKMSAVREWLPGPEDTSGIQFEWTPIYGRFETNELYKTFLSDIASNLTTRIDYIERGAKKKLGRPRRIDHGTSIDSFASGCSSDSSLQSSLPIASTISDIEASSEQGAQSSLGSATSAQSLQERRRLLAELQKVRQNERALQKERDELRQAIERANKAHKESHEAIQKELKNMKAAMRRMTRKKKPATRSLTLQHSDGTTTKLHNVSSVFR